MLVIQLPDRDPLSRETYYVKDVRVRAGATGAAFLDESRLVVTDLTGCSIYLYRLDVDSGTATLLDSRMTVDSLDRSVCHTDLLDFDGRDLVVSSNLWLSTQTLYRVRNDRFEVYKTVPRATPEKKFCHGVKFDPFRKSTIGTANFSVSQFELVDYEREELLMKIPFPDSKRLKDLAWVDADHLLFAYTASRVGRRATAAKPRSALALFRIDASSGKHRSVAEEQIEDSHIDSVIFARGLVLVSHQDAHVVYVFRLLPDPASGAWRFERVATLGGYDRPHGLAFHAGTGLLAATNYGDNSVRVRRLDDGILALLGEA